MNQWINMLFYQATWIAAVAGAGAGRWWPGVLVFAAFAAWQIAVSPWRRADSCLALGVGLLGFAIDSIFVQMGLIHFSADLPWPTLAPIWMVVLWASFALALNHSLAFLQHRHALAALLGGVGAPLAYGAAARGWQALTFGERPLLAAVLVGTAWALLMPLLAALALRLRALDAAPLRAAGAHR